MSANTGAPAPSASSTPGLELQAPANPNTKIATGRSGMAEFAAILAANHIIDDQDNERDWPITIVDLSAEGLHELYSRITFYLVRALSREMGYPQLNAQTLTDIRNMSRYVGWVALHASYLVSYNKGIKLLPSTFIAAQTPPVSYLTFPIFITALINSIGPIQQDGFPAKRTYVPILRWSQVNNARPAGYNDILVNRFFEKFPKTKYLVGNVEPFGTASQPWWAIWPRNGQPSTMQDEFLEPPNQGYLAAKDLFSPVPYSEILNELKTALVHLDYPLAVPGMAHHTATPWYSEDELDRYNTATPPLAAFPDEAREYPYYDKSYKAIIHRVESETRIIPTVPEIEAPTKARAGKRRRNKSPEYAPESPTQPGTAGPSNASAETEEKTFHRVVYFMFQHQIMREVTPTSYTGWTHSLHSIN